MIEELAGLASSGLWQHWQPANLAQPVSAGRKDGRRIDGEPLACPV